MNRVSMMRKFIGLLMITVLLHFVTGMTFAQSTTIKKASVATPQPKTPAPKVYAKRVIVVDNVTGNVLYEKNSLQRGAVASTQKLLTAICVTEAGSLDDKVTVATTDTKVEPSKIYIRPGEVYKRKDLMKALLVKSGNDAARALARDVAGSQVNFSKVMNARAKKMGMVDSHFVNAHGLTVAGQYSTARDVAILMRKAITVPSIRKDMAVSGYNFKRPNGKTIWLTNTNKLLKRLKYCMGGKTGYTNAAGRCLATYGELNGRSVIVVCLNSTSAKVWDDCGSLLKWCLEQPGL